MLGESINSNFFPPGTQDLRIKATGVAQQAG
jgi:hypothetical protein